MRPVNIWLEGRRYQAKIIRNATGKFERSSGGSEDITGSKMIFNNDTEE